LNKAIAFSRVEPLHSACRHVTSPGYDPTTLAQRTVKMKWVPTQKLPGQDLRDKSPAWRMFADFARAHSGCWLPLRREMWGVRIKNRRVLWPAIDPTGSAALTISWRITNNSRRLRVVHDI